jgi:hypothetical protein
VRLTIYHPSFLTADCHSKRVQYLAIYSKSLVRWDAATEWQDARTADQNLNSNLLGDDGFNWGGGDLKEKAARALSTRKLRMHYSVSHVLLKGKGINAEIDIAFVFKLSWQ